MLTRLVSLLIGIVAFVVILAEVFFFMEKREDEHRQDLAIMITLCRRLEDWQEQHGFPVTDLSQLPRSVTVVPIPGKSPQPHEGLIFAYDPSVTTQDNDIVLLAFQAGSKTSFGVMQKDYRPRSEVVPISLWKEAHPKATYYYFQH
jgi:hypothetical protein